MKSPGVAISLPLVFLLSWSDQGLGQYGERGIAAEIFALPGSTCDPDTGSVHALDLIYPNITRKDERLSFTNSKSFDLERCSWELAPTGLQRRVCRGVGEIRNEFAARWTGYMEVIKPGRYTFYMTADDGARLIMGHDLCPGIACGTMEDVLNTKLTDLAATYAKDTTYAHQCDECVTGSYKVCHLSKIGCEPFRIWILDAENGASGKCSTSRQVVNGTRYLRRGKHPFKVEYFQRGGPAEFVLRYSGPDTNGRVTVVPSGKFVFPTFSGLMSEWYKLSTAPSFLPPASDFTSVYAGAQLVKRAVDKLQDMVGGWDKEWSKEVLDVGKPVYIRWTGSLFISTAGVYTFRLNSDDASRLIFGGRFFRGEFTAVDNDEVKSQQQSKESKINMLPGWTPMRLEYLYSPNADNRFGDTGIPKPPHFEVTYKGVDTAGKFEPFSTKRSENLIPFDSGCFLTNWAQGNGLSLPRDCSGKCYRWSEDTIGDYVCDRGGDSTDFNFTCRAFLADQGDCAEKPIYVFTTPKPPNECLISCPAGNFSRRNCAACKKRDGGLCVEVVDPTCVAPEGSPPGYCNYARCCVAKLTGVDYWKEDCISFGAVANCSTKLAEIVEGVNAQPRSWAVAELNKNPVLKADMMETCAGDKCAKITDEKKRDPFTSRLTEDPVCPIGEAELEGVECFMGPWPTHAKTPLDDCQDDKFLYNFCRNRKTPKGKPFVRCCAALWMNYKSEAKCGFYGVEQGRCDGYLNEMKAEMSKSPYTSIFNAFVLQECTGDMCNDPLDKDFGCQEVVIKRPIQVAHLILETFDKEAALRGGGAHDGTSFPWMEYVLIPFGGLTFFGMVSYGVYQYMQVPPPPIWHSDKAKIVNDEDTFVEPSQDCGPGCPGPLNGKTHGLVHPRPAALRQLLRDDNLHTGPLALRLEPGLTMPQAAEEAYEHELAFEASITGQDVDELRVAGVVGEKAPIKTIREETLKNLLRPYKDDIAAFAGVKLKQRRMTILSATEEEDMRRKSKLAEIAASEASKDRSPSKRSILNDPIFPLTAGLQDQGPLKLTMGRDSALTLTNGSEELRMLELPGEVPDEQLAVPPPPPDEREDLIRAAVALAEEQREALPPSTEGAFTVVDGLLASVSVGAIIARGPASPASQTTGGIASPPGGRSAASARLMRNGLHGPVKVCT